ncbi:uncharacterized protein LOC125039135 [Penaeus chinensis]|uniref:uncharacterized protein LOC125039135 n=1 Tax=Penaeus chinensis TaxID=139456 RepID=UPI001FB74EC5|nr:uncharacterized protein LOC125039135 [Penaeus chinensis]
MDGAQVLESIPDAFSETLGCTSLIEHDISLVTTECLKPKIYPIPLHLQSHFEEEVELHKQGIIRSSSHCSPVVMIQNTLGKQVKSLGSDELTEPPRRLVRHTPTLFTHKVWRQIA